MKKISKVLSLSILLASAVYANDNMVIEFEKQRISQNPNVKVNDIKISTKKDIPVTGWTGYILDVSANVQGKI